jgi:O6-methylguanine-DNA--protein-cysteine methyltransferase
MLQPGYNFQTSDPSYAWRLQQGLSALQRGLAQTGQTASGNEMAQLQQYGQGMASQEFSNEFNRQHSSQALTDQEAATAFNQHQAAQALTDQEFSNLFNMQQTEYANQFSRLAQLSGANVGSPGTAGQLQANQNMQQQQAASAVGNAVGNAAGNWLGNYMGDNSTTPASGPAFPVTQAGYQFNSQPILSGGTDLNAFAGYNF